MKNESIALKEPYPLHCFHMFQLKIAREEILLHQPSTVVQKIFFALLILKIFNKRIFLISLHVKGHTIGSLKDSTGETRINMNLIPNFLFS